MAKVVGFDPDVMRKCTCPACAAIVEYAPNEEYAPTDARGFPRTDEGRIIVGITCPNCSKFIRINS